MIGIVAEPEMVERFIGWDQLGGFCLGADFVAAA